MLARAFVLFSSVLVASSCQAKEAGPPTAGDPAPDFRVKDHTGADVSLATLKGKKALIWFYPKAMTGG